ncbi:hypothetical protein [Bailinhaonella thermotolerans]|uniref:SH3 domain-containing protein n=1 Tax=Bailinhaonella thermotolerans TaxID=1070861 RepID=A0A3A4BKJ9_9ACTN|nr:hypothetical protein [Bailinhaonella thermotolerans]RJL35864.1 hypothetical protein D5H75_03580 [Bailinhaonella thermotolerans]
MSRSTRSFRARYAAAAAAGALALLTGAAPAAVAAPQAPAAPADPVDKAACYRVTAPRLAVRDAPYPNGRVVDVLKQGTRVRAAGQVILGYRHLYPFRGRWASAEHLIVVSNCGKRAYHG